MESITSRTSKGEATKIEYETRSDLDMDDHQISVEELCRRFDTDLCFGLTKQKAETILARDGKNVVTAPRPRKKWFAFIKSFSQVFLMLLWLASGVCVALFITELYEHREYVKYEDLALAIVLVIAIVIIGVFSFYQRKSGRKECFMAHPTQETEIIRDGVRTTISSEDIVIGDLILIKFGERIPADCRIIQSQGFKVDNYALTGESGPQLRHEKLREANILESPNIAFLSTLAIEGSARAIVIRTGNKTLLGHIIGSAPDAQKNENPITSEMFDYMNAAAILGALIGLFMFLGIWIPNDAYWADRIDILLGIGLAAIPEGLIITTTISMMLMARRMKHKNCKIKSLSAVEKLGSIGTICLDKGATVTQKKLFLTHLWYDMKIVEVSRGLKIDWKERTSIGFRALSRCAVLCNRVGYKDDEDELVEPKGTTEEEIAVFNFVTNVIGRKVREIRKMYPKVCEIPYNGIDRFQVTIHVLGDRKKNYMIIIGELEILLEKCSTILFEGEEIALTHSVQEAIDKACIEMAQNGESLIGVCDMVLPKETFPIGYQFDSIERNFPLENFRFLGIMSLYDPPRPTTPHAISRCRTAGIKVIMVTSDHPITAKSIAKQIGLISETSRTLEDLAEERKCRLLDVHPSEATAVVVDGTQLKRLTLNEIDMLMHTYEEIVFARTSPLQKFMVVSSCQKIGSVVAVAGSGMNDLLALKKADLGAALGITGSDLTKEIADAVLIDDSLSTLVAAIEEGRLLFDNIKKATAFTLTATVPEFIPFAAYSILGIPLPFSVFLIVFIDCATNIWPAISLIYEKEEYDVMKPPPNPNNGYVITQPMCFNSISQIGITETFAAFLTYYVIMLEHGWLPFDLFKIREDWDSQAIEDLEDSYGQEWTYEARKRLEFTCQTCFFLTIVIMQWGNLIIHKTRYKSAFSMPGNWVVNFGLAFEMIVVLCLILMPINDILHMTYVKAKWSVIPIGYLLAVIFYDEVRKHYKRNYQSNWFYRESYY